MMMMFLFNKCFIVSVVQWCIIFFLDILINRNLLKSYTYYNYKVKGYYYYILFYYKK